MAATSAWLSAGKLFNRQRQARRVPNGREARRDTDDQALSPTWQTSGPMIACYSERTTGDPSLFLMLLSAGGRVSDAWRWGQPSSLHNVVITEIHGSIPFNS